MLCEDEVSRRTAAAVNRRLRAARFDEQVTLEEFDFTASANLPVAAIRDLATLRFLHAGESVVLHGPVGVGKSHVAQALGHLACRRGHSVTFLKASRALAHLAGGHADHTWPSRLRKLAGPALLVLDDFGMRELTAGQADDLYELITERAGKSHHAHLPQGWRHAMPHGVRAHRLVASGLLGGWDPGWAFAGSVARPVHEEHVTGVDQPVEEGLGYDWIWEQWVPVGGGPVGVA